MMYSVVLAAHNRIDIPIHRIMNISCPNLSEENHSRVREVVTGDDGEAEDVRASLKHAIDRMKGN